MTTQEEKRMEMTRQEWLDVAASMARDAARTASEWERFSQTLHYLNLAIDAMKEAKDAEG